MTFDAAGRISSLRHLDSSGSPLAPAQELTYDPAGNILTIKDGATTLWSFRYDKADRLISATNSSGETTAYAYDHAGNMVTRTLPDLSMIEYTYNNLNQLLSAGDYRYLYDTAGNLFKRIGPDGVTTFKFNSDGRLTNIMHPDRTTSALFYNADWEIIKKIDRNGNLVRYLWSGLDKVAEYDDNGLQAKYFYGLGLVTAIKPGQKRFFHEDYLGSIVRLTDHLGTPTDSYSYDPWGQPLTSSGTTPNAFRFVGAYGVEWNEDAQLYHMRARWYDAKAGRFASRDPVRGENPYIYSNNNPLMYIDPMGLEYIITYNNGRPTLREEDPQKFLDAILKAPKGSISNIFLGGHGHDPFTLGMKWGDSTSKAGLHLEAEPSTGERKLYLWFDENGLKKSAVSYSILEDRLSKSASIVFLSCFSAGDPDITDSLYDNIARTLSAKLRNHKIWGVYGKGAVFHATKYRTVPNGNNNSNNVRYVNNGEPNFSDIAPRVPDIGF